MRDTKHRLLQQSPQKDSASEWESEEVCALRRKVPKLDLKNINFDNLGLGNLKSVI